MQHRDVLNANSTVAARIAEEAGGLDGYIDERTRETAWRVENRDLARASCDYLIVNTPFIPAAAWPGMVHEYG